MISFSIILLLLKIVPYLLIFILRFIDTYNSASLLHFICINYEQLLLCFYYY